MNSLEASGTSSVPEGRQKVHDARVHPTNAGHASPFIDEKQLCADLGISSITAEDVDLPEGVTVTVVLDEPADGYAELTAAPPDATVPKTSACTAFRCSTSQNAPVVLPVWRRSGA